MTNNKIRFYIYILIVVKVASMSHKALGEEITEPPVCKVQEPYESSGLRFFQPNTVSVEGWKDATVHDPYLYPIDKTLTYGGAFTTNFDLITYKGLGIYMNNNLHFDEGLDQHIVSAGWQYEVGATIAKWNDGHQAIQIFHQHHSQHELDDVSISGDHYPVYDRSGVRIILYQRSQ